jgi:poly(ADP-ribose) glycohydrolase
MFDGEAEYCVDFANKYIGGGVLNDGIVQEEILFCIDPEAIVSLFLMEMMGDNDAIGIHNIIQYSNYKGYGASFEFDGSAIPSDINKIKRHKIIAIDAINLNKQKFNNNINKNINGANISKNDLNKFNYINIY